MEKKSNELKVDPIGLSTFLAIKKVDKKLVIELFNEEFKTTHKNIDFLYEYSFKEFLKWFNRKNNEGKLITSGLSFKHRYNESKAFRKKGNDEFNSLSKDGKKIIKLFNRYDLSAETGKRLLANYLGLTNGLKNGEGLTMSGKLKPFIDRVESFASFYATVLPKLVEMENNKNQMIKANGN